MLFTRYSERALEIRFCFRAIGSGGPINAISPAMRLTSASGHLSFVLSTADDRFVDAAPSIIVLAKLRIGYRQF